MRKNCSNSLPKNGHLPSLSNDTLVYGIGLALTNGLAFLTFPLLARHLSVGDYGIYDLYATISVLISVLITFGIDSSVGRFFHEYETVQKRKELVSQALVLQVVIIVFFLFILWIASSYTSEQLSKTNNSNLIYELVLAQIPFVVLLNFSLNLLKWSFAKWQFIFLSGLAALLNIVFLVVTIFYLKIDLINIFEMILIGKVCAAIVGLYLISNWLQIPQNFHLIKQIVRFAFPIGLVCIIDVSIPVVERGIVNNIISAEALGQYAAASKVVLIITLFGQAFQSAWGPFSLSIYKQKLADEIFSLVVKMFVLFMCAMSLLITILGPEILDFLAGARYSNAYLIIFPLTMSFVVQSTSWITEIGIGISKKTHLNFYSHLLHLIISAMTIYFLTFNYGVIGTAYGVLSAQIIRTLIISVLAQKAHFIEWPFKFIGLILAVNLTIGVGWLILPEVYKNSMSTTLIVIYVIFLIICAKNIYSNNDRNQRLNGKMNEQA